MKLAARLGLSLAALLAILSAPVAMADVPGLQVSPLQYEDTLTPGHVKTGYVDVSNPGDSLITVETSVRGFRQIGTEGRLEFFDDPGLAAGIKISLPSFDLGPREAVRVVFTVDPAQLPRGGVYAALFFRTVPPAQVTSSSYVAESAAVGTLLELTNGPAGPHQGAVKQLDLPFWQFGSGLRGQLTYTNTDRTVHPLGFRPRLTLQVLPWAARPQLATGLVLPGTARQFAIARPGSFFGLLPVTVTDADTHISTTRWVFACTGWCQWSLVVLLVAIVVLAFIRPHHLSRLFRRSKPQTRHPIDGLSPRKKL